MSTRTSRRIARRFAISITWLMVLASGAPAAGGPETPAGASIWTAHSRQRMVKDALKVAPPALVRIIRRHPEAILEGLARGAELEGQPHHRQDADLAGTGAAASMATVARRAVEAIDGHRPMREIVFYLGLIAHFAIDLSDPVLTAPEGREATFTTDYARYAQGTLGQFPVVFYGYPDPPARREGDPAPPAVDALEADGRLAAGRSRGYFPHLSRAYASGGSSATFDVRSIPFGVASLCYSRGVTNIARAWLQVWRSARGDLTGTPHLIPAGDPGAGAERESRDLSHTASSKRPPPESPHVAKD